MCECGCSSNATPYGRLAAPYRQWYVLSIYPGCKNCDTPAGVSIDLMSCDDVRDQDIDLADLPILADREYKYSGVPVVALRDLQHTFMDAIIANGMWTPEDDIEREIMQDELGEEPLIEAVRRTEQRVTSEQKQAREAVKNA